MKVLTSLLTAALLLAAIPSQAMEKECLERKRTALLANAYWEMWQDYRKTNNDPSLVNFVLINSTLKPDMTLWFLSTGGKNGFAQRTANSTERTRMVQAIHGMVKSNINSLRNFKVNTHRELFGLDHPKDERINRHLQILQAEIDNAISIYEPKKEIELSDEIVQKIKQETELKMREEMQKERDRNNIENKKIKEENERLQKKLADLTVYKPIISKEDKLKILKSYKLSEYGKAEIHLQDSTIIKFYKYYPSSSHYEDFLELHLPKNEGKTPIKGKKSLLYKGFRITLPDSYSSGNEFFNQVEEKSPIIKLISENMNFDFITGTLIN